MILLWSLNICNNLKVSKNSKDLHVHFCSLSLLQVTLGYSRFLQVTLGFFRFLQVSLGFSRLLQVFLGQSRFLQANLLSKILFTQSQSSLRVFVILTHFWSHFRNLSQTPPRRDQTKPAARVFSSFSKNNNELNLYVLPQASYRLTKFIY